MSTAIFFGTPEYGHTNPSLPVVAELVRRGEHIIYYSLEEFRPVIEHTGQRFGVMVLHTLLMQRILARMALR